MSEQNTPTLSDKPQTNMTIEETIEKSIESMLLHSSDIIAFNILSPGDCGYKEGRSKTGAVQNYNRVELTLVDGDPLEIWAEAIEKAKKLIQLIIQKKAWEETNPVFSERIKAKIRNARGYQMSV